MIIQLRPKHQKYDKEKYKTEQREKTEEMNQTIKNIAETWQNKPEDIADFIQFKRRFYRYSLNNSIIIYAQNPNASYIGSFNSFKEKGYSVKAGQHGLKIFVPVEVTLFRDGIHDDWKRLSDATKEQKEQIRRGELESRKELNFKLGTVFDISQTDCPLEDYPKLLGVGYNSDQHAEIYQGVKDFCSSLEIPVEEKDLSSITLRGFYSPGNNSITVNKILGDTQKLSTITHELGHALLHKNPGNKSTVQMEFEADALSLMLESEFGIPPTIARKNHLANHYRAYKDTLDKQESKNLSALESIDTILKNVSLVYLDYKDTLTSCIQEQINKQKQEKGMNTISKGKPLTKEQLQDTYDTILDYGAAETEEGRQSLVELKAQIDNYDNPKQPTVKEQSYQSPFSILYDKSTDFDASQLIQGAKEETIEQLGCKFKKGDVITACICLDDGQKHDRLFLISDSVPALGISEGYNLTSINAGEFRKAQYITNVPLLPNEHNKLNVPSVVKMNSIYPIHDWQGNIIGHLTKTEEMIIDEYSKLFKKYGLQRYNAQLNLNQEERLQYELYKAAAKNEPDILSRLIRCGANINDDRHNGFTPLHQAAAHGAYETMRLLLEQGTYVDSRDNQGITPLRYAAQSGNKKAVDILLQHGADVKIAGLEKAITPELTENLGQTRKSGRSR